jgi:hypothetical protein
MYSCIYCKITVGDLSSVHPTHRKDALHFSAIFMKILFAEIIVKIKKCE